MNGFLKKKEKQKKKKKAKKKHNRLYFKNKKNAHFNKNKWRYQKNILVGYYQEVIYENACSVSLKIHECYVFCAIYDIWNIKTFSF